MYRVMKQEFYGKGDFTYKPVSPLFYTKEDAESCMNVLVDMQINVSKETCICMTGEFPSYKIVEMECSDFSKWLKEYNYYLVRVYGLKSIEVSMFLKKYGKM